MSLSKLSEKNPLWKGDNAGYYAIHAWIRKRLPKPELCVKCNQRKAYDLSNTGHTYKRKLSDWEWLCRKCHMIKDDRYNLLYEGHMKWRKNMKNKTYEKELERLEKKYGDPFDTPISEENLKKMEEIEKLIIEENIKEYSPPLPIKNRGVNDEQ